MRKFYWYFTAYIKKHGLIMLASVFGAILTFSILMPFLARTISIRPRRYIGIVGEHNLQTLPLQIKNQLSAGLTTIDTEDYSVKPMLAERWITENDGRTYRFSIKQGIKWQDGLELTPDSIFYNLKDVEIISTPNDVVFKLPDIFSPFPAVLSEPILRHTLDRYLLFFQRPSVVGVGSYHLSNYKQQNNRLNELVLDGPNDRLIYRFYMSEEDAIYGFKKGEVNTVSNLKNTHGLESWGSRNITIEKQLDYSQYLAVFFNHNNPLITRSLKQALNYALEKPTGDERAVGPISPLSWAYLEGGKDYSKDWERGAERMLATPPTQPVHLSLSTVSTFSEEAEQIKTQLEEFGVFTYEKCKNSSTIDDKNLCVNMLIKIDLRISNFPDTQNFQLLLLGQAIPVDPDQYLLWHSEQPTNFSNYKNTRIDSLLEKGRQTINQQERKTIYQEFQQFLLEDPPAIFLRYLPNYTISR